MAWIIDEQLQFMGGGNLAYPRLARHPKVFVLQLIHVTNTQGVFLNLRRGQIRLFREFLQPRRPAGHFNPKEYFNDLNAPSLSVIRDPLHETVRMMVISVNWVLCGCAYGNSSLYTKGVQWWTSY
jgi:hypothetical protein